MLASQDRTYSIRPATPHDADAVSSALMASYSTLLVPHYARDLLERVLPYIARANPALLTSQTYYVAQADDGTIVGCGGWTREEPGSGRLAEGVGHIRHFATDPAWTRRGIASALLARCLQEAEQSGIRSLDCFATLGAESFYASAGFEPVKAIIVSLPDGLGMPSTHMRRSFRT